MKVKDHKKYACFDYVSNECSNPLQLGDIVIKRKDYEGDTVNEIGVILQVHDNTETRTDMFGNECNSMLELATLEEIEAYRPKLLKDIKL